MRYWAGPDSLFKVLGILTCDQLKAVSEKILIDNFGLSTGHWLYAILRTDENLTWQKGETDAGETPKSIGHSYTLPRETWDENVIYAWLRMLSEMVAERARKSHVWGHTTSLWLNSKNESLLRQKTHLDPTNDGWEIFSRARAIFGQRKGRIQGVRAIGVTLSGLISDATPPLLTELKKREALLSAMDSINAKYGDWTLSPAILKNNTLL